MWQADRALPEDAVVGDEQPVAVARVEDGLDFEDSPCSGRESIIHVQLATCRGVTAYAQLAICGKGLAR